MKSKLDLSNQNIQFIIAGMSGLITENGKSHHEVFETLEVIKRETFHALAEIYVEERAKESK